MAFIAKSVLLLIIISGCNLEGNKAQRDLTEKMDEICLAGVVYYRYWKVNTFGIAPKFLPDSTVELCK